MTFADETCPNCGAEIPERSIACPDCGSCDETGWKDESYDQSLGLVEEEFDYEEFIRNEFSKSPNQTFTKNKSLTYSIVTILITISLILILLLF